MIWRLLALISIHGHHQNLNQKPGDRGFKASGSILRHGRAWATFGKRVGGGWLNLRWEWNLWSRSCGAGVSVNCEDGFCFHFAFPPISLWFCIDLRALRKLHNTYDWYDLRFSIHHWAIWVSLWAYDAESRNRVSFWSKYRRRFNWYPLDTVFGRTKLEDMVLHTEPITVPMPEANYAGTATLKVRGRKRKRKRWPWWPAKQQWTAVDIDMTDPVPFPGKGENSWDCGEDATHGYYGPAASIEDAVGNLVTSTLKRRRKYGGRDWKPEAVREAV